MIRRLSLLLFILSFLLGNVAAETEKKDRLFDFGITAGAVAPFVNLHGFYVNGVKSDLPSFSSQIGYQFSLFSRINIRKHFIQLQPSLIYYRNHLSLDFDQLGITTLAGQTAFSYSVKAYSFDISLLYGYNFIKNGPFRLFFVVGPKFKYVFHQDSSVSGTLPVDLEKHVNRTSVALEAGLGTTISRLALSLRYEFDLLQDTDTFFYEYEGISGKAKVERSMNAIYVSLGVLF